MRGVIPAHLSARFAALDALAPAAEMPAPWTIVAVVAVGGLTHAGFADSTDLLLAISPSGRSVFECRDATRVVRDDEDAVIDAGNLTTAGIGPLTDRTIRLSGLSGGGFPTRTSDGWGLERNPAAWPDDEIFLSAPGQTLLWSPPDEPLRLTKLAGFAAELRAYGFSPTGNSFVVATAADITIATR